MLSVQNPPRKLFKLRTELTLTWELREFVVRPYHVMINLTEFRYGSDMSQGKPWTGIILDQNRVIMTWLSCRFYSARFHMFFLAKDNSSRHPEPPRRNFHVEVDTLNGHTRFSFPVTDVVSRDSVSQKVPYLSLQISRSQQGFSRLCLKIRYTSVYILHTLYIP